jgi:dihydrofolate reductase
MSFSIIAAHEKNRGIGKNGKIPWYIPDDFNWFKIRTTSRIVVMGLTTYFSLPNKYRPLPDRENLVLCDNQNKKKIIEDEGGAMFSSIKQVIDYCENKDCFVIGGASIYKQFIDLADTLYLTEIDHDFDCDTFFPIVDSNIWVKLYQSEARIDEKSQLKYTFNIYERRKK